MSFRDEIEKKIDDFFWDELCLSIGFGFYSETTEQAYYDVREKKGYALATYLHIIVEDTGVFMFKKIFTEHLIKACYCAALEHVDDKPFGVSEEDLLKKLDVYKAKLNKFIGTDDLDGFLKMLKNCVSQAKSDIISTSA